MALCARRDEGFGSGFGFSVVVESGLRLDRFNRGCRLGVGKDSEIADPVKAARQDMQQIASDELGARQGHDGVAWLLHRLSNRLAVAERDAGAVKCGQARVSDCDAVGVARQVPQKRLGPCERLLGVDVPLDTACIVAQRLERLGVAIARDRFGELELSGAPGALTLFEEAAAEVS